MTHALPWRLALAAALAALTMVLATPRELVAQAAPAPQAARAVPVRSDSLAVAFGITLPTNVIDRVGLGDCITGTLDDPLRLARYGIHGLHVGARVTLMRSANDRLQVEADEMDPVAKRASTVVRLDAAGQPIAKP